MRLSPAWLAAIAASAALGTLGFSHPAKGQAIVSSQPLLDSASSGIASSDDSENSNGSTHSASLPEPEVSTPVSGFASSLDRSSGNRVVVRTIRVSESIAPADAIATDPEPQERIRTLVENTFSDSSDSENTFSENTFSGPDAAASLRSLPPASPETLAKEVGPEADLATTIVSEDLSPIEGREKAELAIAEVALEEMVSETAAPAAATPRAKIALAEIVAAPAAPAPPISTQANQPAFNPIVEAVPVSTLSPEAISLDVTPFQGAVIETPSLAARAPLPAVAIASIGPDTAELANRLAVKIAAKPPAALLPPTALPGMALESLKTDRTAVALSTSTPAILKEVLTELEEPALFPSPLAQSSLDEEEDTEPDSSPPATEDETELFQGTDEPDSEPDEASDADPRVLIAEVVVSAIEGTLTEELIGIAYEAIETEPGRTTTQSQLQEDINSVFETGFFSNVRVFADDTPLGVRVTFVVQPNPLLTAVQVKGNEVLPQTIVDETFQDQYGEILNLKGLQNGIEKLNQWYQGEGYVLAQVVDAPQVAEDGIVTLEVAEGVVEDVRVRFFDEEGLEDEDGNPIEGRTREYVIKRYMRLKPGDVFNRNEVEKDLQRIFGRGLFEDVRLALDPGEDPRQAIVTVEVDERNSGSISAGAGFSSASGLFGTVSYQERNLGGNEQQLGAEVQLGTRELLFDVNFTDPWIGGDPFGTSYTVNAFRRRTISLVFDRGETDVDLPNGDRPRVLRLGGGVTFTRPLSKDPLSDAEWTASLGLRYQDVSIRDADGDLSPRDELGNLLSFNDDGTDTLATVQFGIVRDLRNNRLQPTKGSFMRLATEQSIPIGGIFLNRLRGSYSHYIPVSFTNFNEGPQALAFNVQAGTVIGDLPPYEAFPLGGTSSVRGYRDGDLGSGRSFLQATVEYRFPLFSFLNGVLFVDAATDIGSGSSVPGDPAGVRDKPGSGFGYGLGVRVRSPLGPIRVDFGINDQGENRVHFGIGERF